MREFRPPGLDQKVNHHLVVIIPCYKVVQHILAVLAAIGPEVSCIVLVDDACPDGTGAYVSANCIDPRVVVVRHDHNRGVGGAVITGYRTALALGCEIIVKIDGDGQMDPSLIPAFVGPLLQGEADYTKGNRFFDIETVRAMPVIRLFGNAALSFLSKLSTGYWTIFDPTNGYTAIRSSVLRHMRLEKISERYFFESDMLFRLGILRAVVVDVPMSARYADEASHLRIRAVVSEFLFKHMRNTAKRILYTYFIRDLSLASLQLIFGLMFSMFGSIFGAVHWWKSYSVGVATPAGTVMLAALPLLLGFQLLLAFVGADIASVPRRPIADALAQQPVP